jgi:VWFA-related protein
MPSFRVSGFRYSAFASALALLAFAGTAHAQNQPNQATAAAAPDQNPIKFKAKSNLVVVRVVVRDSKGKPVEGLRKQDFKLFDQGKEQAIAQFEEETSAAPAQGAAARPAPKSVGSLPQRQPAMPGKFLALFFDELNTPFEDMARARDAADHYLSANLQPNDRVGIFTSEKMLSDFTADPKQLHDALYKLHPSARSLSRDRDCPNLSDYQAFEITEFSNDTSLDAWTVALDEAAERGCMGAGGSAAEAANVAQDILMLARRIVAQSQMQSRDNLQELEQVVNYTSQMPGQRTIILVTSGFLSHSEQPQLDRIIDRAVRSEVVISALDAEGLAVMMREMDVERFRLPTGAGVFRARNVDAARQMAATDVMAELAQGTGGEFFHNNNDLKAGFGALAGSPVYYVLAFAPAEVKLNGKFHAVKVTLAEKEKGVSIQARRGYFAPKDEADAEAQAKQRDASEAEAQIQEQIREALYSKAVLRQLPVVLYAQRTKTLGETRDISFSTHLDTKPLRLRKDVDHNVDTVIFMLGIFDEKQHLVASQQRRALIHVPDSNLQHFLKTGVDAEMSFNLKPGLYTVREVVTEAEDHNMAAFSHEVKIP